MGAVKGPERPTDQKDPPAWQQPFVVGYIAVAAVIGLLIAGSLIAEFPRDTGEILAIFVGGALGGAIVSAAACGVWPGYRASAAKLVMAAFLLNPATYALGLAMFYAMANQWVFVVGLVLFAAAAVPGAVFQRARSAGSGV